jgi:hypothetical protein
MRSAKLNRRDWLKTATAMSAAASLRTCLLRAAPAAAPAAEEVREMGSRRELFVDHWLIEHLEGAALKLHEPQLAPPMTEPADNLEYGTVIKDGDLFRLYTRDGRGAQHDGDASEVTRYCESRDGIHWVKPRLGLHEIDGSTANNAILHEPPFCHNFSPFLDTRSGVPADQRFKALAGTVRSSLVAFVSEDGIHWHKLRSAPVITYTREYASAALHRQPAQHQLRDQRWGRPTGGDPGR